MATLQDVCDFLKQAKTYHLATVDGDQPRVRPFGTSEIIDGKLYIQTGAGKDVFKQIIANPKGYAGGRQPRRGQEGHARPGPQPAQARLQRG